MLPKKNRLTADRDFARIFAKGRSVHGRAIGMRAVGNRLKESRFGFVVSTKVSKDAVVRNTLKRRMREIVRKQLPKIVGGVDIVFTAKQDAIKLPFGDLERTLLDLLGRARLIQP